MKRGDIHIDVALTNVAVAYTNDELVADKVLTVVPVAKQADKVYTFGKESFRLYDDLRANGAEAKEVMSYSVGTDNYFCDTRALKDIVTDEDRTNADAPIMPDTDTTEALMKMRMLRREYDTAAKLFNTATFAGYTKTMSGTDLWSDYTNSDPIANIEADKASVHDAIGTGANKVLIGIEVWRKLKHHPDVLARMAVTGNRVLTTAIVADLFEVDEVIVGGALYEGAVEGQTSSLAKIWGNYCLTFYQAPGKKTLKTPSLGVIPTWKLYGTKTAKVKKYRWEPRGGDMIEVESAYDVKVLCPAAGYLRKTVV